MQDDTARAGAGERFERLVGIMARLRGEGGCPWDRQQTFDSIKPYTLEETYEVLDAIDRRDWRALAEELGDLILQAVFYAQMAAEAGHFTISDALDAINSKLVRRHPHVFGSAEAKTAEHVLKRWNEIKEEEKRERGEEKRGLLDGVLRNQPALMEAAHLSKKAAAAGFDWPDIGGVFEKMREEIAELEKAREGQAPEKIEEEIGDLLFTVVNVARFLGVDPEQALRRTNAKFRARFAEVENGLAERGRGFRETTIEEMEELWQRAKNREGSKSGS
ncbi:MAG: nucleoside triphosphate pyrophosphohydrolase [Bryobacteraceae bacterium]|nr:nucleoside triphosphate pyrophosphohydrolase [Bryobacteraceae bacterium]